MLEAREPLAGDQYLLGAGAAQPKALRASRTFDETSVKIETELPEALSVAVSEILLCRIRLGEYIALHPGFRTALEPIEIDPAAPEVVKRMAGAAHAAGVGPMAAVAGAIADLAVEAMAPTRARIRVVENGGEIAAESLYPVNVEVRTGNPILGTRVGWVLSPSRMPMGVGSSSSTEGRGLTFGEADVATVFAVNAATADAAATAVCNAVVGEDIRDSIRRGLRVAEGIPGALGAFIARKGHIGTFGDLPELVEFRP